MKTTIRYILWIVILYLCYLVYESIAGRIRFEQETKYRRNLVIERLRDIRQAQIAFKARYNRYSGDFDTLLHFVQNDSFHVVKAMGTVPDTLTEDDAVKRGIVVRDTVVIAVKDSVFSRNYLENRHSTFFLDSLPYIPFSAGKEFKIQAGVIEKSKLLVNVFEIFAAFSDIYQGMDLGNTSIDPEDGLRLGSMTDPTTSGNWGE